MSKKIPLGLTLALIFLTAAVTFAVTVTVYMKNSDELIQDLPQKAKQYSKLTSLDELVRAQYYGDINYSKIDSSLADGYIEGLGDSYCSYIAAENYDSYMSYLSGVIPGVGLNAFYDASAASLYVSSVDADSPASDAEIAKGDYIKSVNGIEVTEKNCEELLSVLGNGTDESVTLSVIRQNGGESAVEVKLKSGYSAQSCSYSVNGTIGYIRITNFYDNTYDLFCAATDALIADGVTGLIIDVRSNYSTNVDAAVKIIDRIVPLASQESGALATAKNSDNEIIQIYSSDAQSMSLPIAVLINDRTEGAAELLACDLRDFGKGYLIGETTVGHGTLQKLFRLDDGGAVSLTVAKIYPYSNDSYDGIGVKPDEIITMTDIQKNSLDSLEFSEDGQYQAAYSYLSK